MKIGLNGQNLIVNNPAGPEKYTFNVFQGLAKIDHENEYVVYVTEKPQSEFWQSLTQGNLKFRYKVLPYSKIPLISWTQMILASELFNNKVGVFFSPIHTLPVLPALNIKKTSFVVTIHDLGYENSKELENKPLRKFLLKYVLRFVFNFSDGLIVPSNYSKNQVLNHKEFKSNSDKIFVIPEGVSERFKRASEGEIERTKEKYGVKNDYLFFISTIQPRKNIPNLIEGFAKTFKENPNLANTKLLIAGKNGWEYEESLEAPKKYGIEKNVQFLGRIPDKDIMPLMSGAKAYVNPSLEEGFGLPVLEAMSCEAPLLLSDIPPFKEIAQGCAIYFDPKNTDEISEKITKVLTQEKNLEEIEQAKQRAKQFTWENTAKQTLSVFQKVVKNI